MHVAALSTLRFFDTLWMFRLLDQLSCASYVQVALLEISGRRTERSRRVYPRAGFQKLFSNT